MKIEEKINAIMDILDSVYCDNCRHQNTGSIECENCHRKYMGWGISKNTARKIISKIERRYKNDKKDN